MPNDAVQRALAKVDDALVEAMNEHTLAGLAVGVVQRGDLIYSRGLGFSDVASHRPVDSSTVFRIGSISKTFTAIAVMQLWEQGKIDLDRPVSDYLRSYRLEPADPANPPTVRHLLTHTGGIGEVRSVVDLLRLPTMLGLCVADGKPIPSLAEYYGGRVVAEVPPGRKWAYGNHAFATLGQMLEDVSGEPFVEYMRRHVFGPLGMESTDFVPDERLRQRLAQGYAFGRGRLTPAPYMSIVVAPAGSAFSTLEDMGRYVAALMNGGANTHGSVLKPESLEMMLRPQHQMDPRLPAMGLAFILDQFGTHRIAGHNGGLYGFISAMLVAPDDRLAVLAFTNTSDPAPDAIVSKLLRELLGEDDPASRLPRPGVLERPDLWPELVGDYGPPPGPNTNLRVWMGLGGEVRVAVKGHHLELSALLGPLRKGVRLYPVDAADPLAFESLRDEQATPLVFQRGADGKVNRLLMGMMALNQRTRAVDSVRVRAIGCACAVAGLGISLLATRLARRGRR